MAVIVSCVALERHDVISLKQPVLAAATLLPVSEKSCSDPATCCVADEHHPAQLGAQWQWYRV